MLEDFAQGGVLFTFEQPVLLLQESEKGQVGLCDAVFERVPVELLEVAQSQVDELALLPLNLVPVLSKVEQKLKGERNAR